MIIYPKMNKNNTALLVIDPINSCAHENCESPEYGICFTKIRQMIPKLNNFVDEYRQRVGGLVAITKVTPWNAEHLALNINELYTDPNTTYYSDDTTGFDEQFFGFEVKASDLIFTKNTYDSFADDKLTVELKNRGIKYVVVIGVFTDGCVLASVVSGFSRGFNFVILKDLIETTDLPIRQQIQKMLIDYTFPMLYGKTITSGDFIKAFV